MLIHEVSEYVNWEIRQPEFYIQELLAKEGSLLIYGAPGVKKSWLVEYMGFCVATGSEWLGFPTQQARVLLVNFEISSIGYHWRLKDMNRNFALEPQMLYEASPSITPLDERAIFDRFAADVRPIQPNVIILDCLSGCFGGDENNSREMSTFIRHISELKAEHLASVVIVHHSNKNILAVSAMDRSRGHTKLPGWVDTVIYMVKQPSGVQLQFSKTRLSRRELRSINIQFQDHVWSLRTGQGGNDGVVEH